MLGLDSALHGCLSEEALAHAPAVGSRSTLSVRVAAAGTNVTFAIDWRRRLGEVVWLTAVLLEVGSLPRTCVRAFLCFPVWGALWLGLTLLLLLFLAAAVSFLWSSPADTDLATVLKRSWGVLRRGKASSCDRGGTAYQVPTGGSVPSVSAVQTECRKTLFVKLA